MAAVSSVRNGGAAGTKTTKGLFLICTLLCLICSTSSLLDKEKLMESKAMLQKTKQQLERLKDKQEDSTRSDMLSDYIGLIDPWTTLVKQYAGEFPEVLSLLQKTDVAMKKTKAFVDKTNDDIGLQIKELEKKIKVAENLINFLEEQQAEL
ncbi:hypothetical protein ILYODFUR_020828 [Ilyodon furcidens]|uniref:Uncharacterized protein n=1 Tax=Ilyodon furcidens TaxID=33524 RepID=A0ABV0VFP6_9TELE